MIEKNKNIAFNKKISNFKIKNIFILFSFLFIYLYIFHIVYSDHLLSSSDDIEPLKLMSPVLKFS
jgi:hypothetical protein